MDNSNSFRKGFFQVQNGHSKQVKNQIMEVLGITSNHAWYHQRAV